MTTTPADLPAFLLGPDFGSRLADLEALAVRTDVETETRAQEGATK